MFTMRGFAKTLLNVWAKTMQQEVPCWQPGADIKGISHSPDTSRCLRPHTSVAVGNGVAARRRTGAGRTRLDGQSLGTFLCLRAEVRPTPSPTPPTTPHINIG